MQPLEHRLASGQQAEATKQFRAESETCWRMHVEVPYQFDALSLSGLKSDGLRSVVLMSSEIRLIEITRNATFLWRCSAQCRRAPVTWPRRRFKNRRQAEKQNWRRDKCLYYPLDGTSSQSALGSDKIWIWKHKNLNMKVSINCYRFG